MPGFTFQTYGLYSWHHCCHYCSCLNSLLLNCCRFPRNYCWSSGFKMIQYVFFTGCKSAINFLCLIFSYFLWLGNKAVNGWSFLIQWLPTFTQSLCFPKLRSVCLRKHRIVRNQTDCIITKFLAWIPLWTYSAWYAAIGTKLNDSKQYVTRF